MAQKITPCPNCGYEAKRDEIHLKQVTCDECGTEHSGPDQVTVGRMIFKQGDRIHYRGAEDARIIGFTERSKPDWDDDEYSWMMIVETGGRIDNWLIGSIVVDLRQNGRETQLIEEGDDR